MCQGMRGGERKSLTRFLASFCTYMECTADTLNAAKDLHVSPHSKSIMSFSYD